MVHLLMDRIEIQISDVIKFTLIGAIISRIVTAIDTYKNVFRKQDSI